MSQAQLVTHAAALAAALAPALAAALAAAVAAVLAAALAATQHVAVRDAGAQRLRSGTGASAMELRMAQLG